RYWSGPVMRLQFYLYCKNAGHLARGGGCNLALELRSDGAPQGRAAVLNEDVNWGHRACRVPEERRVPVIDCAIQGNAKLVVSRRDGKHFDFIDNPGNALEPAYPCLCVIRRCRPDDFASKDDSAVRKQLRFQPVKDIVVRKGHEFVPNGCGQHLLQPRSTLCVC